MKEKKQAINAKASEKNCDNCKTGMKVVELRKAGDQEFMNLGFQVCVKCSRNPMSSLLNSIAGITGVTLSDLWERPE